MALNQQPVLAEVALRRPQTRRRSMEPVESSVRLAGGSERRYNVGSRIRWALSWRNLPEAQAEALDAACSRRGVLPFIDQQDEQYAVLVDSYSGLEAIPGTMPTRYNADVELVTQGVYR